MINRRNIIAAGGAVLAASFLPMPAWASESRLIYLSPFKSDRALSRCQAEIWYAKDGDALFVVTASEAWRARAIDKGLTRTQIWVGDVGMWKRSGGRYKKLPALIAEGARIDDPTEHARLLGVMGKKYSGEWSTWGPRFKNGLANGSRVLLKYTP